MPVPVKLAPQERLRRRSFLRCRYCATYVFYGGDTPGTFVSLDYVAQVEDSVVCWTKKLGSKLTKLLALLFSPHFPLSVPWESGSF